MKKSGYIVDRIENVKVHLFSVNPEFYALTQEIVENNSLNHKVKSISEVWPGGAKIVDNVAGTRRLPCFLVVRNKITQEPVFVMNSCYFINHPRAYNYGEIQGRCQGEGIDNRPEQREWLSGVLTKNLELKQGYFHSWEYPREEVILGYSPAIIGIHEGKLVQQYKYILQYDQPVKDDKGNVIFPDCMYSLASTYEKVTFPNTQTIIMQDSDNIIIGVVDGFCTPHEVCLWAMNQDVIELGFLDSGASSYAYYYPKNDIKKTCL